MVEIREATARDAGGIASVHVATWQVAYRGIVADDVLDSMDVVGRARRWREGLLRRDGPTWVAEDSDRIIGWANAGPTRDTDSGAEPGELYGIYVEPPAWGTGVGPALMAESLDWLRARFPRATLWTLEANARARAFYERYGWTPDGTSQFLEGLGVDEVRYRIDLSGE